MVQATKDRTRTNVTPSLVHAWPNQTEASGLLGVEPSTLLRRNLPYEEFGSREKRFAPRVVLSEALYYKRVPVQEVAAGLYEIALDHATKVEAREIAREADAFLIEHQELRAKELTRAEFLAEARRSLPRGVYRQVESIYLQKQGGSGVRGAIKAGAGEVPALIARARKRQRRHA
jgi:hypothetical protein